MNKNMLVIFVLAISLVLLSGCAGPGMGKKEGKLVLLESLIKSKSIKSSELAYDANINAAGMSIKLTTGLWSSDNQTRADLTGTLLGFPLNARYYNLQEGAFSCTMAKTEWTCKKGKGGDSITDLAKPLSIEGEEEKTILDMVLKGALIIQTETTESTIANRKCDNVNMAIDTEKLSKLNSTSELMKTAAQMKDSNVSTILMTQCFDQETGYPLYFKMSMNATSPFGGGVQEISFEMTATKFAPNQQISSDIFTLPAIVTEEASDDSTGITE